MSLGSRADRTTARLERLRDRAAMLGAVRAFFADRKVCEVDCPALSPYASVDTHIDLMPVSCGGTEQRYLHSSPEFGMKRLLSEGFGDIYQLSHVFRDGESSRKHNPEFTLLEWYRVNGTFEALIEETLDLIRLFLGPLEATVVSYRKVIQQYLNIDYIHTSAAELSALLQQRGVTSHLGAASPKDDLLNILLGLFVEPHLGEGELTVLTDYPASQAALAQTRWRGDEEIAERFEIYYQGIELANGYHELTDALEQRKRFAAANASRVALGKDPLPIDEHFLRALKSGMPDCCGVAVGIDRLMMLRHNVDDIREVLPFHWHDA